MREILFRGKRKDTGEWIQGDFCGPCNIVYLENGYDAVLGKDDCPMCNDFEVIPETVGQYTGLTDKNGKKIFEGDLLLSNGSLVWLVSFENGAFVCKDESLKTYFTFYEHSDYDTKTGTFNSYISNYEVIGNIHDNPELLKGGAE